MRTALIALLTIMLMALTDSAFAQEADTDDSGWTPELSETQLAGFMMQIGVLSQRFERTTPEMRTALTVVNGMLLLERTAEDVQGYLSETLDLLARTNLPNPIDAPLAPTGNGLLDAYLAEVEQRVYAMQLGAEGLEEQVRSGGIPSAEFLAACKTDYGSEPDYWELKYVGARAAPDSSEQALGVFAEAEQAGCADGELLCNWFLALRAVNLGEAYKSQGENWDASAYTFFTDEMFDEEVALLDRAIALDPDNAWPYYQRGLINLLRGNAEDGLHDLEVGNAAPEYTPPLLFPQREIRDSFTADHPAGSVIADGAFLVYYMDFQGLTWQAVDILLLSQVLKVSLPNHASPDDELVLELWDYLVRTGQLKDIEFIDRAAVITTARRLLEGIGGGDEFSELHPDLAVLSFGLYRAQREVLHNSPDYFSSIITMTFAGGIPGLYAGYYAYEEANFNRDPATQAQVFADLAELDIRTMTPPPSWEKYRAKGEEQQRHKEESLRKQREEEAAEAAVAEGQEQAGPAS
jgi:hypothetical protein